MNAVPAQRTRRPRRIRPTRWSASCLALSCGTVMVLLAGCGPATSADAESTDPSPSAAAIKSDVIGYWHRPQTCSEMLAAFEAAGFAQTHTGWLQGNFYGGEEGPTTGDLCAGAQGPLEHSHWFTEAGEFGSNDQAGQQVDSGDFVLVDSDTLSFPSHAAEFGYGGDVLVDFTVDDRVATFSVIVPEPCDDGCQNAHAWALSAFASGPWEAGDVP